MIPGKAYTIPKCDRRTRRLCRCQNLSFKALWRRVDEPLTSLVSAGTYKKAGSQAANASACWALLKLTILTMRGSFQIKRHHKSDLVKVECWQDLGIP